jgi:hypothetical protein
MCAAEHWFGYGSWDAPYWFVGMEPGGDDDHASYDTWLALDPKMDGLIDCREHHVERDGLRFRNREVLRKAWR